jgi:hypothetical protein
MDRLVLIDKTKDTGRYTTLTYKDAAAIMTLDVVDLELSIAEHGRCARSFGFASHSKRRISKH